MTNNPIKVLFNTPPHNLQGGPSQHLPFLENELKAKTPLMTFEYGRKSDNENIISKIFGRLKDLVVFQLKIWSFSPDVIHQNTAFDAKSIIRDAPLICLSKINKIPIMIKVHGSHQESFGKMLWPVSILRSYVVKNADCIAVLSSREKKEFIEIWPGLTKKIKVVKNIIKPEFFEARREEEKKPKILFVSRVIKKKGVIDLLEAMPRILKEIPEAKLLVIGSGEDSGYFDAMVNKSELKGAVERLDNMPNTGIIPFYSGAWCLAFPTHYPEGMPMVVAEAMATGCPIVTTRTRFSLSYMEDNKNCVYINKGDPDSLSEGIISMLKDRNMRNTICDNNRELAKNFTADKVMNEYLEVYKWLCQN
ncbi:MAG: glycosyltransferase family 4 protein [Candidatus Edwardsbacteria bacterium]|nr:glycosyltransferase family 4 protein [Candidatus Edwardsbacteria bacterium]